jgi:asparagine synthase (glutamine-hydrolysing)
MCGIILGIGKGKIPSGHSIAHRGPDQQYEFSDQNYKLCFARLSITGIHEGHIPIISQDLKWSVYMNGEIYNYKNLIERFALPHSDSDTRVIAEGISKYGIEFLKELRGMYALVCINLITTEFYIARDPLGEKPLYYAQTKDSLVFSSEIRSLMEILDKKTINPISLASYFRFGYVEEPNTILEQIHPFPKGICMKISNSDLRLRSIFSIKGYDENDINLSLHELLTLVVREGVSSEVASGLALSGGVDSSLLLSIMLKNHATTALVVDFPEHVRNSEATEALNFSRQQGASSYKIEIQEFDLKSEFLDFLTAYDQPHADLAGFSYYKIFQAARDLNLKVVHLGHGPDEFFWGYEWLYRPLQGLGKVGSLSLVGSGKLQFWETPAKSNWLDYLLPDLRMDNRPYSLSISDEYINVKNPLQKLRSQIVHSYLSHNAFQQSDRLSMKFGVEARSLWSDTRIYGWSQINSNKMKVDSDKTQFRKVASSLLLHEKSMKRKLGFASPLIKTLMFSREIDLMFDESYKYLKDLFVKDTSLSVSQVPIERYRLLILAQWLSHFGIRL